MHFAERMSQIRASGVRRFFDEARRRPDAIDLSIGQADFDVPEPIRAATAAAVESGNGRYSATQGMPALLDATREHLIANHDLPADDELMMTVGASGAITLALLALAGPGDEVLVPDPYFVIYRELVQIVGATPVFYDLFPDFRLRPEELEKRITDRTRLVILNTPANPTGVTLDHQELAAVAQICRSRGVPVLSDELYELFVYDGPHAGIKRHLPEGSLLVGGFSKGYGMAGWRLGWAAGTAELIDRMRILQQFVFTCPPTLVQQGAIAAFDVDMSEQVATYAKKRDIIYEGLVDAGFEVARPGGSFFVFPRVPWGDDEEFCMAALESGVIVVPGRSFSQRTTHFRISFATSDDNLHRGLEILATLKRERHP